MKTEDKIVLAAVNALQSTGDNISREGLGALLEAIEPHFLEEAQEKAHEAYQEAFVKVYPKARADIEMRLLASLIDALDMKEGESLTRDQIVTWLKRISDRLPPVEA